MGKPAGRKVSGIVFRIGEREEAGLASNLKSTIRNKGNMGHLNERMIDG